MVRALVLALALFMAGCAIPQRPPPPSIADVIAMAKSGMPADEIIRRLSESNAVYRLSGSEFAKLKTDGVPDKVLDYIKQVELYDARYREWQNARDMYWYPPYGRFGYRHPGWWYAPPFPLRP